MFVGKSTIEWCFAALVFGIHIRTQPDQDLSLIEDPTTATCQRVLTPDLIVSDSTAPPRRR